MKKSSSIIWIVSLLFFLIIIAVPDEIRCSNDFQKAADKPVNLLYLPLDERFTTRGLFLDDAAKSIIREINDFENVSVEEVMALPVSIAPETTVLHFVDNILPMYRQTIFPVAKNRQLYGILSLEDLKALPREAWHIKKIQSVMRPITTDYFVESTTLLTEAREMMRSNGIGALGVIDTKGNLVGFLQRGKIRTRQK